MTTSTPENTTDTKGRIKEATGDITGNDRLKNEGRTDQAAGKVKHFVDEASNKVKGLTHRH